MKISIITVSYNSVETIARTLQSVREQTFKDVEHILIDGGSDDGTLAVIALEGWHLANVVSEKDGGIYDAMNKGIKLATGNIIAFLNADDFYKDSQVLMNVAMIMETKKLDVLYGDVDFFRAHHVGTVIRRYNSGRFTPEKLGLGLMPAHPALFIDRELFERCGKFSTDYKIAGDFEFIVRLFKCPELKYFYYPKSLVSMQMGGVSTSGWRATILLNQEIIKACRQNSISTNWMKILLRYPQKLYEFLYSKIVR